MKKAVVLLVALFFVAGMLTSVLAITKAEAEKKVADTQKAMEAAKKLVTEKTAAYNAVFKWINIRKGLSNADDPKVKKAKLELTNAEAAYNSAKAAYDAAAKELNNILNPPPPSKGKKR